MAAYPEQTIMPVNDEFFARVGHDLRGELATMLAGVHYLLRYEKQLSSTSRDMLERVRGAGDRLRRLLDEFDSAVWLRPDPSRPMLIAPCDAGEIVRAAAARLGEAAAARGVSLLVEEADAGPIALRGDADLLRLALEQVIGFAITRSRDTPVRVDLAGGGVAVVTVVDEAGPVAPDVIERLLQPFAEREAIPADPVAPRRRERLGLGLAIAGGILEAHGGGLSVAPSPAGPPGLQFTCMLGGASDTTSDGAADASS